MRDAGKPPWHGAAGGEEVAGGLDFGARPEPHAKHENEVGGQHGPVEIAHHCRVGHCRMGHGEILSCNRLHCKGSNRDW